MPRPKKSSVGAKRAVDRHARPAPPEHTSLEEALKNFLYGLSRAEQLQLAFEVALSRGPELCRAYKNVVKVTSGFRTRRDDSSSKPKLHREPCIGFIVERKWRTPGRRGDPQALPKHLLAFGTVGGKRALCAIPTDVRLMSEYGKPVPHATADSLPYGILVDRENARYFSSGVATCGVRRPVDPGTTYVISCRHVLSRTSLDLDRDQTGLPILLGTPARPELGATTDVRGRLDDDSSPSFDAQLAALDDAQALDRVLGGISFDAEGGYLERPGDIEDGFWVATGRVGVDGKRLLIWVEYHDPVPDFEMPYQLADGTTITVKHDLVLHGVPEEPLLFGDSGSPAIRVRRGQRLIGMYIGGSTGHAYVIPAWQLMTPRNFGRGDEQGWTLV
jgi:hypothetical protein